MCIAFIELDMFCSVLETVCTARNVVNLYNKIIFVGPYLASAVML